MKQTITPDMKLSDLIDINYTLVQVISRMGVDLRLSGLKVSEACSMSGIDTATFILVCNVYSSASFVPAPNQMDSVSVSDIIRYLRGSHSFYTGMALRELEASFDRLLAPCDSRQKTVVMKFYYDYKTELERHFAREEREVFPYIEALGKGCRDKDYSIDQFEEHHERVDEKLEDMKNIVMKYLPEVCDQETKMWVLLSVCRLRDDLRRHTYVEDNILVPLVRNLERDGE